MKVAAFVVLFLLIVSTVVIVARFDLSAIPAPTRFETRAASIVRHWIISRKAREHPVPEPFNDPVSVASGGMAFNGDCAFCHGQDGKTPSDIGQAMYPRVASLASPEVQQWSDAELFWIIRNGNRYTGMAGFGKTLTDDQIWDLVHYVRSLRDANPAGSQPETKIPH
jgi:mono/diheme cytochrome c family protein